LLQLRQESVAIVLRFEASQAGKPVAEGGLQLPAMPGQMVMELSQVHSGAVRPKLITQLQQPGQAALPRR
jgi:hypothetical protein